jgi:AAA domain
MPNLRSKSGQTFRGLFVGPCGSGKTVALGSFPGPMMIYDFDDRVDPLIEFYKKRDDISYKTVSSWKSGRADSIDFMEFCQEWMEFQERCDYATVAIDSISNCSACCVLYALQLNKEFNWKKGARLAIPGMNEYKSETAVMLKILEVMKGIPAHTICTAQPVSKLEMIEPGNMETLRPTSSLTAYGTKTPSFIPNYFNEMYLFHNEVQQQGQKPKRYVTTVANGDIPAKTALPIPPIFEITDKPLWNMLQMFIRKAGEAGVA